VKNITVVGSGVSGVMAALYLEMVHSHRPNEFKIVYINTEEEQSDFVRLPPHITMTFRHLSISVTDLVRLADAAFCNGTKYVNFRGGGEYDSFMNPYRTVENIGIHDMHNEAQLFAYPGAFGQAVSNSESSDKSDLVSRASKLKKVGFRKLGSSFADGVVSDPLNLYGPMVDFGLNLKTKEAEEFLLAIAKSRNVEILSGNVESYEENSSKQVSRISLDSGKSFSTHFIVDVSGYGLTTWKEVFGKAVWVDMSQAFPANSAITFNMRAPKKLPAYTELVAMEYGYLWKTPLQSEIKCGYVYDNELLDVNSAKEEAERLLNTDIEDYSEETYNYGYVDSPLKSNVLLSGASSMLLENKEAVGIWSMLVELELVFTRAEMVRNQSEKWEKRHKELHSMIVDGMASLLQFSYFGREAYNEFWSKFTKSNAPYGLHSLLEVMDWRTLDAWDVSKLGSLFNVDSYYYIGLGIKYKPLIEAIKESVEDSIYIEASRDNYDILKVQQAEVTGNSLMDHRTMLEELKAVGGEGLEETGMG